MTEESKPVTELKSPSEKDLTLTANGKTYIMESKISIERKIECDKLIIELTGGGTMGENFNDWKKVYEAANAQKFADIVVLAYNRMEGVKNWQERHDPVLSLCALFINEKDEDRRTISKDRIKAKIADWESEGIEYAFFFSMASGLMKNLSANWKSISLNILETETQPEEKKE